MEEGIKEMEVSLNAIYLLYKVKDKKSNLGQTAKETYRTAHQITDTKGAVLKTRMRIVISTF
jgi:hypothetical protein